MLLYEAFKEVNQTTAGGGGNLPNGNPHTSTGDTLHPGLGPAGFKIYSPLAFPFTPNAGGGGGDAASSFSAAGHIYEDFTRYLVPLGGEWPVVSMKKLPRSQKFSHWKTTGTEQADACLRLGRRGGPPFEFVTALLSDNATFGKLKCMGFQKDERLVLEDGFYYPFIKNHATFDAFVYHAETRTATVLQITINRHSVNNAGFEWLKSLGVKKVSLVGVTPVGAWIYRSILSGMIALLRRCITYLWNQFLRNNTRYLIAHLSL